jgi:ethanolamine utilization protein EutN
MQIARVCGTLVSTLKHPALAGHRMLIVQPCDPHGQPSGPKTMALDTVDAGVGDRVLVLDEGASASGVLEHPRGPVRTLIVGIVDEVHLDEASMGAPRKRQS